MPYRLVKGIYSVRCRYSHCPFHDQVKIEQNIAGVTEEDVRTEASKTARDQATVKHDEIYGRRHGLENPEVRMVSGMLQKIGGGLPSNAVLRRGIGERTFRKGEVILKKGEAATTVCEILEGSAYPLSNTSHRYAPGDCFGVAALVPNKRRLSDIVAKADGTTVAFYDLSDLRRSQPDRASRLVSRVMEDTLRVLDELGRKLRRGGGRIAS